MYRVGSHPPLDLLPLDAPASGAARWDDPQSAYRVLYAATSVETALVEKFYRYKQSAEFLAREAELEGRIMDPPIIGADKIEGLSAAALHIGAGEFADLADTEWLTALQYALAPLLRDRSIEQLSLGHLLGDDRTITQAVSRVLYTARDHFAGIVAPSSRGGGENWSVFEFGGRYRAEITELEPRRALQLEDADVVRAFNSLGLVIDRAAARQQDLPDVELGREPTRSQER